MHRQPDRICSKAQGQDKYTTLYHVTWPTHNNNDDDDYGGGGGGGGGDDDMAQLTEELKQKVSAKTQQLARLARYKKRQDQYYHNKLFKTDCKKCYNHLGKT